MKIRLVLAILLTLSGLSAAQSFSTTHAPLPAQSAKPDWNWADDSARITQSLEFAASKAICEQMRGHEPLTADWPDATTAATLADCDSAVLYYGIGTTADPVRARQCALLETTAR